MRKTAHPFPKTEAPSLSVNDLARQVKSWLLDSEVRQLSRATIENRRIVTDKLLWYCRQEEFGVVGLPELRQFLAYLSTGHESEGGRWDNGQLKRKAKSGTAATYYGRLRSFFNFLVDEGVLESSPLATMKAPVDRPDQIQPFTLEQVTALMNAAKRSRHPKRDFALISFMLDTGVRASEVCSIRMSDVDISGRRVRVLGKGNKERSVYFGASTTKALWAYLREEDRGDDSPLFMSDRGTHARDAMTRSGLLQLMERLGKAARIDAARCSPHTCRHTFAVEFLRNGGNLFTLQQLLGHTGLKQTQRYVALAQADMEKQHRAYSPVDRMKGKTR